MYTPMSGDYLSNGVDVGMLSRALEVEMWEMFDFGYVKSHKDIKAALQTFIKTADEPTLRLASKIIRAVVR